MVIDYLFYVRINQNMINMGALKSEISSNHVIFNCASMAFTYNIVF